MKTITAGRAGILSSILASACCIGPLLLVAIGLGGVAAFIGRYHWILLTAGAAVLAWAWVRFFREKRACDCEGKPMESRKAAFLMLTAATGIVLGFGALNASRYLPPEPGAAAEQSSQTPLGLSRVIIPVEGMTCATCEFALNRALRNVDGVHTTNASAARNAVAVEFNPEKIKIAKLVEAINATGYSATLPQKELR